MTLTELLRLLSSLPYEYQSTPLYFDVANGQTVALTNWGLNFQPGYTSPGVCQLIGQHGTVSWNYSPVEFTPSPIYVLSPRSLAKALAPYEAQHGADVVVCKAIGGATYPTGTFMVRRNPLGYPVALKLVTSPDPSAAPSGDAAPLSLADFVAALQALPGDQQDEPLYLRAGLGDVPLTGWRVYPQASGLPDKATVLYSSAFAGSPYTPRRLAAVLAPVVGAYGGGPVYSSGALGYSAVRGIQPVSGGGGLLGSGPRLVLTAQPPPGSIVPLDGPSLAGTQTTNPIIDP